MTRLRITPSCLRYSQKGFYLIPTKRLLETEAYDSHIPTLATFEEIGAWRF